MINNVQDIFNSALNNNGVDQQEWMAFYQSPEGQAADEHVRKEFQAWRKKQYGLVDNSDIANLSQRMDIQDENNAMLNQKLDAIIKSLAPFNDEK